MSGYVVRPLSDRSWLRPSSARQLSRFRAGWSDTESLLLTELDRLDARDVVLEVDVQPADLRLDGRLRARAPAQGPAVRVACATARGPLLFASDLHPDWQDNVRAIALTLQALRAVDRYGVAGSGEQYRGWTAIEAGPADLEEDPLDVLRRAARWEGPLIEPRVAPATLLRRARRHAHPDTGGSSEAWNRVQAAAAALGLT